jgi:hypothetical protein
MYTINCNYKMAAKLYTLETWFVSDIELCIHCIRVNNNKVRGCKLSKNLGTTSKFQIPEG